MKMYLVLICVCYQNEHPGAYSQTDGSAVNKLLNLRFLYTAKMLWVSSLDSQMISHSALFLRPAQQKETFPDPHLPW